jgi:hypothetical protein
MTTHDPEINGASALSGLALGIVNDVQSLVKQQLVLFKHEIKKDFHQARGAAVVLICGVSLALVSLALLGVMAAFFIHWAVPAWDLGVCFGIAGAAFAIPAGALLWAGKSKLGSVNPMASDSVEAMKENVQWIMKSATK